MKANRFGMPEKVFIEAMKSHYLSARDQLMDAIDEAIGQEKSLAHCKSIQKRALAALDQIQRTFLVIDDEVKHLLSLHREVVQYIDEHVVNLELAVQV